MSTANAQFAETRGVALHNADGLSGDSREYSTSVRRIIHMAKHCSYANGNVHVAVDLACVQADSGCEVAFVSGGGTFEPLLRQHGVQHIKLEQDQGKPFSMLLSAWRLFRLVRAFRPDVLHAHMMGSAAIGWIVSRISGVPLITTVHNSFDPHSKIMRLGKRVVAVSIAEKAELVRRGYPENKVDVVMNAPAESPRESFMQNATEPVLQSPCIVAVCGLHRRKGVFVLLDACSRLFREIPDWHLYIAGEGPDREALEEQSRKEGIADRVTFLGFLPSPRSLLEQADLFVLSSFADPCSLVIGEARAAGCAIVATAVGGTPEMLEHGNKGRLVPPGNASRLATELHTLMCDPEARADLRRASLHGAEVFNVHRLIGDYDLVYRRALATKRMLGAQSSAVSQA